VGEKAKLSAGFTTPLTVGGEDWNQLLKVVAETGQPAAVDAFEGMV
jgi:hypothetical protein